MTVTPEKKRHWIQRMRRMVDEAFRKKIFREEMDWVVTSSDVAAILESTRRSAPSEEKKEVAREAARRRSVDTARRLLGTYWWWKPLATTPTTTLDASDGGEDPLISKEEVQVIMKSLKETWKREGRCPECGSPGEFLRGALVCREHGAYGGI